MHAHSLFEQLDALETSFSNPHGSKFDAFKDDHEHLHSSDHEHLDSSYHEVLSKGAQAPEQMSLINDLPLDEGSLSAKTRSEHCKMGPLTPSATTLTHDIDSSCFHELTDGADSSAVGSDTDSGITVDATNAMVKIARVQQEHLESQADMEVQAACADDDDDCKGVPCAKAFMRSGRNQEMKNLDIYEALNHYVEPKNIYTAPSSGSSADTKVANVATPTFSDDGAANTDGLVAGCASKIKSEFAEAKFAAAGSSHVSGGAASKTGGEGSSSNQDSSDESKDDKDRDSLMMSGDSDCLYDRRLTRYCGKYSDLESFRANLINKQSQIAQMARDNDSELSTQRLGMVHRWSVDSFLDSDFTRPFSQAFVEEEVPSQMFNGVALPSFALSTRIIADAWANPCEFIPIIPWLCIRNLPNLLSSPLRRLSLKQQDALKAVRLLQEKIVCHFTTLQECAEAVTRATKQLSGLLPDDLNSNEAQCKRYQDIPAYPVVQYLQDNNEILLLKLRSDNRKLIVRQSPELILKIRFMLDNERRKLKYQRKAAILKEYGLLSDLNLNLDPPLNPDAYCVDRDAKVCVLKRDIDLIMAVKKLYLSFEKRQDIPLCVGEDHYRLLNNRLKDVSDQIERRDSNVRSLRTMLYAMRDPSDKTSINLVKRRAKAMGIAPSKEGIQQALESNQPTRAKYDPDTHEISIPLDESEGYSFLSEPVRLGRHLLFNHDCTKAFIDYRVRDDQQLSKVVAGTYGIGQQDSSLEPSDEESKAFTVNADEALQMYEPLELYEGLINTVACTPRDLNEEEGKSNDASKNIEILDEHIRDPRLENTYCDALREYLYANGQFDLGLEAQNNVSSVIDALAKEQNVDPYRGVGGITIMPDKPLKRGDEIDSNARTFIPDEKMIQRFLKEANTENQFLRRVLRQKVTAAVSKMRGRNPKGREIDPLRAQFIKIGEDRIFKKRFISEDFNTSIHILVDISGSMCHVSKPVPKEQMPYATRCYHACKAALSIASALYGIDGVLIACSFFPGFIENSSTFTALHSNERLLTKARDFLQEPHGSTPMDDAIYTAMRQLNNQTADRKIIIMITDGAPDDVDRTKHAIESLEQQNIELYAIGIETQDDYHLFKHFASLEEANKLTEVMSKLLIELSKSRFANQLE